MDDDDSQSTAPAKDLTEPLCADTGDGGGFAGKGRHLFESFEDSLSPAE